MKKPTVNILLLVTALQYMGCSMQSLAPSSRDYGSPQNPPFPRTESILPLECGNAWVYSYTAYDSTGAMILPHRLDLNMDITAQYGLLDDTTLVRIYAYNQTNYPDYAYQYEMEAQGIGYLVVYRSLYPLSARGLYIIGEYRGTAIQLYPHEEFWLAYPADSGKSWQFRPDPLGDSVRSTTMEIVSTHAECYMLEPNSMAGTSAVDSCYLYKETNSDTVAYYYYNQKYGAIAYQQYIRGTLRATYVLKSFSNSLYYGYVD
ncbi:MAG: hypothetical protein JW699_01065 [Chitinispirillaceae bacterium]|nr:hypothetical protein [Chitinispirillaceae bacterium]